MLLDFEDLLEEEGKDRTKYEKATNNDLAQTMPRLLALLMRSQYLYALDRGVGSLMRILDYPSLKRFVDNYFATAGYVVEYNEIDGWVGLFPEDSIITRAINPPLSKDLTVLLLLCANIFSKDQQDITLDDVGCSSAYVDDIFDEYQSVVGEGAPASFRKTFDVNVAELKAKNIVEYAKGVNSEDDQLIIRPMILRVVGPDFQERLDAWLEEWLADDAKKSDDEEQSDVHA